MIIKIFKNQYLLFLLRIILGFVFVYSAITKIIDTPGFSDSISNYKLLPDFIINFFAIVLPWIELTAGLLLLLGISVKENAFIINFLLVVFLIAITINLIRGLDINCGCFGTQGGTKIGLTKLIENTILLFFGIILMVFDSKVFILEKKGTGV